MFYRRMHVRVVRSRARGWRTVVVKGHWVRSPADGRSLFPSPREKPRPLA